MHPLLTRNQCIGTVALLLIIAAVETVILLFPQPENRAVNPWEVERAQRDSARQARHDKYIRDSIMWDSMRVARRDKHHRDSLRWDSIRTIIVRDSLRRDSARKVREATLDSIRRMRHEKRDTLLCLNSADTASLQFIRGIGRYTATQIVYYRESLGGFVCTSQLREIETLSTIEWDSILPHLMICDTVLSPIPVNRASIRTLTRHPYLNYSEAEAIYNLRRRKIRLQSIHELESVLSPEQRERITPYLCFE